jgi:uncharacterized membrane protein
MPRVFLRRLLQLTIALCALGMLLLLVLLIQGSAEQFPTGEQEGKLRIALGFLVFLLAVAAGMSLMVLKRLKRHALSQNRGEQQT